MAKTTEITIGEVIGIAAAVIGIGSGIKGAADYHKAQKLKAEAEEERREMVSRIRRRAMRLKKTSGPLAG